MWGKEGLRLCWISQQAVGATFKERNGSSHETTRRVERPMAPIQISKETGRIGLPASRSPATSTLGLFGLLVQLFQVEIIPQMDVVGSIVGLFYKLKTTVRKVWYFYKLLWSSSCSDYATVTIMTNFFAITQSTQFILSVVSLNIILKLFKFFFL